LSLCPKPIKISQWLRARQNNFGIYSKLLSKKLDELTKARFLKKIITLKSRQAEILNDLTVRVVAAEEFNGKFLGGAQGFKTITRPLQRPRMIYISAKK
jgi:hypothetical protein